MDSPIASLGHLSEDAHMSGHVDSYRRANRYGGWFPEILIVVGVIATVLDAGAMVVLHRVEDPLWTTAGAALLAGAIIVRWARPELPASAWFVVGSATGPMITLGEAATTELVGRGSSSTLVAWVTLIDFELGAIGTLGTAYLIGLFPDGRPDRPWQHWVQFVATLTLPLPLLVVASSDRVPISYYLELPAVSNPLHVFPGSLSYDTGQNVLGAGSLILLGAVVLLLLRYRAASTSVRRRIRWLLPPLILGVVGIGTNLLLRDSGRFLAWVSLIAFTAAMAAGSTMGILQPARFDADRVLRRVLVYGVLWLFIAGAYATTAALVGVAAGQYLSIGWAVAIALLAAVAFQPIRTQMERWADRWVFGPRAEPAEVIVRLGSTLAETFDLTGLLPRMTEALEEGLGLEWARVRLRDQASDPRQPAEVSVPIVLDAEQIGVVECGPKRFGAWTDADRAVVNTFSRQAALAVHNVRLTERLAAHVDELAASRIRLVQAQERERRAIERDIHDGVQQDLVALIGLAGQLRAEPVNGATIETDLSILHTGLNRVLGEVRDLARGIHPSLLTDRGLLVAVEALTARHPVSVDLRADPSIRDERFAEEAEAACYFTVAEALANSLKHARASSVEVTLARWNGSLRVTVADDGVGFDAGAAEASDRPPLSTLRDRVAALDGTLTVSSEPGSGTLVSAEIAMPRR
jgi:signal transduction histidine kinase